ncbi:hypothetical protein [Marinomonas aquiplantarum]|uniref:Uncharacterized protein n=1 Tax=Marinomonas aquiplantarum TaxID=491951 RepID=A0A366D1V2_9GAMM|nr:hypothetical protein [Marinomonas aquiplantarum]RBO83479.1 hypothetical protein DFP76_104298 [Marinomonas aquiplantarum]
MSSTIKKVLTSIDSFFGFLASVLMRVLLYVFSFIVCVLTVLDVLTTPFYDESSDAIFSFSLNELDNLEAVVILTFIFVTVRFFRRSKAEGVTLWPCLKSYVFVSAVSVAFSSIIYLLVLMLVMFDRGEISLSVFDEHSDLQYFSNAIFTMLALYAFAPLPKLGWLQKMSGKQEEVVSEPDQSNDFTHSEKGSVDSNMNETDSSHSSSFHLDKTDNK